jgi:hypothetical protein
MMTDQPTFDHDALQIDAEEISPNEWRIRFEVPAEQVMRFIRQLRAVKPDIHPQETSSLLVSVVVEEALARIDRDRAWEPALPTDVPPPVLHPEKPFAGTLLVDGFAQPTWPDMSLVTLSLSSEEVGDDLVEREMLDQRLDAGTRAPLVGPLEADDECDLSATLHLPESPEPVVTIPRRTVRVPPAGAPLNAGGIVLDGGDALAGHAAGDDVVFETILSTSLPAAEMHGRKAEARVHIHETRRITPVSEDEVVARYGSPSSDVLRMQVRFALQQRRQDERRGEAVDQIFAQLTGLVPIEIPERITTMLVERRVRAVTADLEREGLTGDDLAARLQGVRKRVTDTAPMFARRRVLTMLLRLHFELSFSEEDILAEIRRLAGLQGRRPEDLRQEMVEAGTIDQLRDRLIEGRIADRILPEATQL